MNHDRRTLLLLMLAASCSSRVADYCDESTTCDDPAKPFCDLNGQFAESDFISNTCIPYPWDAGSGAVDAGLDAAPAPDGTPAACEADTTTCEASKVVVCGSNGTVASEIDCPLGCHASEARCNDIDPSNGLATELDAASGSVDVLLSAGATIDTDTGTVRDGDNSAVAVPNTMLDGGGRPVGILVLRVRSLDASDLTVSGARALAIVSDGDIVLRGHLSVSADQQVPGAGALASGGSCDAQAGPGVQPDFAGGGGGGFGTAGGNGGNAGSQQGGTGGSANGAATLAPLRGGCPGAYGGGAPAAFKGAGGGGIQLVSRTRISLVAAAFLSANGSGAAITGGACFNGLCNPPAGGGSGGGVLLEAPEVSVPAGAGLVANGGGGGCGSLTTGWGQSGSLSDQRAAGADCSAVSSFGDGGKGAAGVLPATAGVNIPSGTTPHGGGGGGGAGRIRVNVAQGSSFSAQGVVSPTATVGVLAIR